LYGLNKLQVPSPKPQAPSSKLQVPRQKSMLQAPFEFWIWNLGLGIFKECKV